MRSAQFGSYTIDIYINQKRLARLGSGLRCNFVCIAGPARAGCREEAGAAGEEPRSGGRVARAARATSRETSDEAQFKFKILKLSSVV